MINQFLPQAYMICLSGIIKERIYQSTDLVLVATMTIIAIIIIIIIYDLFVLDYGRHRRQTNGELRDHIPHFFGKNH